MRNVTLKTEYLPRLIKMTASATTVEGAALHEWLQIERNRRIKSGQRGGRPLKKNEQRQYNQEDNDRNR
jgi:hypothetical protein